MAGDLDLAARIEGSLRRRGNALRAEGARRYLKSELEFVGVTAAELRAAVREALGAVGARERVEVLEAAAALWRRPVFELRAAAVEILDRHVRLLAASDVDFLETLLRESRTWALVDWIATRVVGALVEREAELYAVLDRWAADDDFWVRRAALLSLLAPLRRGGGDFARFARYADPLLEEREFFIRKAIGWVLREVGKKRPALVEAWLRPRLARSSGLTLREAVKYLPGERRQELLAAHRAALRSVSAPTVARVSAPRAERRRRDA